MLVDEYRCLPGLKCVLLVFLCMLFYSDAVHTENRHLDLLEGEVSVQVGQFGLKSCYVDLNGFERMIKSAINAQCNLEVKEDTNKRFWMSLNWSELDATRAQLVEHCIAGISMQWGRFYNEGIFSSKRSTDQIFVEFNGGVSMASHDRSNRSIDFMFHTSEDAIARYVGRFCK